MVPELARALTALDPAELGARIRAARVAAKLTQLALGAPDASVAYVSRIESGQRRPGPDLLEAMARRLGVTPEFLVVGADWEDARRLELALDHAELSLVGGDAEQALAMARQTLAAPALDAVTDAVIRARYVEAAALDALGDPTAAAAFHGLLAGRPDAATRLKAATALSRIWREQGQLSRSIAVAQTALTEVPAEVLSSEEGIRLSVTLAAALFLDGRTEEAAEICDVAIAESERLASPVARASAYWNASMIRAEAGEVTEALGMARRALHLLENTERVRDIGRLRTQLGAIMLRADPPRVSDAKEQLRVAETELVWSEASPADRARNDLASAQALFMDGDAAAATQRAHAALSVLGDGLPLVSAETYSLLGQVAWATGDREASRGWYVQAIGVLTGVGADREAGQLWFELGTLADEVGLTAEALDAYRRAAASTGLRSRLPVMNPPPAGAPRVTPASTSVASH